VRDALTARIKRRFGGPAAAGADRFTCPHCGGRMTFAPDGQSLTCEFCEIKQHLGQPTTSGAPVEDNDFVVAMATARGHLQPTTQHIVTCQGCGAVFILPPEQVTATCPYCRSNFALRQAEMRTLITPEGLISFNVDELAAVENLKAWMDAEPAVGPAKVAPWHGIYLPVWSFSLDGKITWHCQVQSHGLWLPSEGEEPVLVDNVLVLASQRLPDVLHPAIARFDLTQLMPYDERYLASWIAETYQMPVAEASLEARQSVLETEKKIVMEKLTSQHRDLVLNSSDLQVEGFKLILLPIWLTHYTVGDHTRWVLINGQSGEVFGERPQSGVLKWIKKMSG